MEKYKLGDTVVGESGATYRRVVASKHIPSLSVKIGDIGGLISDDSTLSQLGDCWISYDSVVERNSRIEGDSYIQAGSVVVDSEVNGKSRISNSNVTCSNIGKDSAIINSSVTDSSIAGSTVGGSGIDRLSIRKVNLDSRHIVAVDLDGPSSYACIEIEGCTYIGTKDRICGGIFGPEMVRTYDEVKGSKVGADELAYILFMTIYINNTHR